MSTKKEQKAALVLAIDALQHLIKEKQRYITFPEELEKFDEAIGNWAKAVIVLREIRNKLDKN
jgi:hypothetical protein